MQFPDRRQLRYSLTAILFAATLASTAEAQSVRISRAESDIQSRGLPAGGLGSTNDLRNLGGASRSRNVDYSRIDRRALSTLVRDAWEESGRLYTALDTDYRRNPQLRSLMTDLSRLRSDTNRLNQNLATKAELSIIVEDFRATDADWRLFSTRMSQARGLGTATRQSLERIDLLDREIGKLFQVAPSLDRRSLLQQLSSLENSLDNLNDELQRDPAVSGPTISSSRKLQVQASRITTMVVDDYSYDRIVSEYNRFDQAWNALMPQLRGNQNSYIERTVSRLSSANYAVHELLWMENTTSRAELKQTADILIRNVDEFYKRTSLLLLLNLRNAGQTMEVASEFYGTVQNFRDNLERSESDTQIVDSYRYVEESGIKFISTFRQTKSQAAIVVLQEIEDGIAALRRELNLGGSSAAVDLVRLRPIAASIEDLADQMNVDVRQWLNSERPAFRNEASTATQAFVRRTQNLHRLVDSDQRSQDLQSEVDALYNDWKQVYTYLERCRSADRSNLAWRARLINESLVDLDTQLRP